jgi:hypothetical protein
MSLGPRHGRITLKKQKVWRKNCAGIGVREKRDENLVNPRRCLTLLRKLADVLPSSNFSTGSFSLRADGLQTARMKIKIVFEYLK